MATLELFNNSLTQYASLNSSLHKVANEVNGMASAAAGAAHSATESQKHLQQIAMDTASQLASLADANRRQQEVWVGIQSSMEQYKGAFSQTERAASRITRTNRPTRRFPHRGNKAGLHRDCEGRR